MYLSYRKVVIFAVLIGLALTAGGGIYWYQQVIYTASLDTRPLNVGIVGEINSLQPAHLGSPEERLIASTLYEGLVYYDEEAGSIKRAGPQQIFRRQQDFNHRTEKAKFSNVNLLAKGKAWEKFFHTKEWANISLFLPTEGSQARLAGPLILPEEAVDSDTCVYA